MRGSLSHVVDVILPVLDEVAALPAVLDRIPDGFRPLVVDNGSRDGSGTVARSLGARVVVEPRRGFGAACYAGLTAARSNVVCFMDCDGSLDPRELPRVTEPVSSGAADLCLGARTPTTPEAWPWHARLANRALAFELRRRCGVEPDRPRPDARGATRGAARARVARPWVRLAARDGAPRCRRGLACERDTGLLRSARRRALEGVGKRPRDVARGPRHGSAVAVSDERSPSAHLAHARRPRTSASARTAAGPVPSRVLAQPAARSVADVVSRDPARSADRRRSRRRA